MHQPRGRHVPSVLAVAHREALAPCAAGIATLYTDLSEKPEKSIAPSAHSRLRSRLRCGCALRSVTSAQSHIRSANTATPGGCFRPTSATKCLRRSQKRQSGVILATSHRQASLTYGRTINLNCDFRLTTTSHYGTSYNFCTFD